MIDYKKVSLWIAVCLIIALTWGAIGWACGGCNNKKANEVQNVQRDSTAQKIIDSLATAIEQRDGVIDSLGFQSELKDRRLTLLKFEQDLELQQVGKKTKRELFVSSPLKASLAEFNSLGLFCYDSTQQVDIQQTYIKKDYLLKENQLLAEKDSISVKIISNYRDKVTDLYSIIDLKDTQLSRLEKQQVITVKRKWYVDAAIIAGSLAVGFTIKSFIK
jgi:hypothetical protein